MDDQDFERQELHKIFTAAGAPGPGQSMAKSRQSTRKYLEMCMLGMDSDEYAKIWEALYGFDLLPIESITCPVLVLNGEYEPKSTFRHSNEILRRVPGSMAKIVPEASHAMNIDNQGAFNCYLEEFLGTIDREAAPGTQTGRKMQR